MNLHRMQHLLAPLSRLGSRLGQYLARAWQYVIKTSSKWVQALPLEKIRHKLKEPARILAGTLTGLIYGPMTAAVLGVAIAVLPGVIRDYSDLAQAGAQFLQGTLVVAPIFALTIGLVALAVGGIVGAINTLVDSDIGFGLGWAPVAGLATGISLGFWFTNLQIGLLGFAGGGVIGGAVGFLTWLTCSSKRPRQFSVRHGIAYGIGLLLIGACVPLIVG